MAVDGQWCSLLYLRLLHGRLGHLEVFLDGWQGRFGKGLQIFVLPGLGFLLEQRHRLLVVLDHGLHVALIEFFAFQLRKLGMDPAYALGPFGSGTATPSF